MPHERKNRPRHGRRKVGKKKRMKRWRNAHKK